jgi:hypothetical protein
LPPPLLRAGSEGKPRTPAVPVLLLCFMLLVDAVLAAGGWLPPPL